MTDQQPHTPTTDEMRKLYLLKVPHDQRDRRSAEFDRFIAAAEQRGKEQGWDAVVTALSQDLTVDDGDMIRLTEELRDANPYRADQIQGVQNDE